MCTVMHRYSAMQDTHQSFLRAVGFDCNWVWLVTESGIQPSCECLTSLSGNAWCELCGIHLLGKNGPVEKCDWSVNLDNGILAIFLYNHRYLVWFYSFVQILHSLLPQWKPNSPVYIACKWSRFRFLLSDMQDLFQCPLSSLQLSSGAVLKYI